MKLGLNWVFLRCEGGGEGHKLFLFMLNCV